MSVPKGGKTKSITPIAPVGYIEGANTAILRKNDADTEGFETMIPSDQAEQFVQLYSEMQKLFMKTNPGASVMEALKLQLENAQRNYDLVTHAKDLCREVLQERKLTRKVQAAEIVEKSQIDALCNNSKTIVSQFAKNRPSATFTLPVRSEQGDDNIELTLPLSGFMTSDVCISPIVQVEDADAKFDRDSLTSFMSAQFMEQATSTTQSSDDLYKSTVGEISVLRESQLAAFESVQSGLYEDVSSMSQAFESALEPEPGAVTPRTLEGHTLFGSTYESARSTIELELAELTGDDSRTSIRVSEAQTSCNLGLLKFAKKLESTVKNAAKHVETDFQSATKVAIKTLERKIQVMRQIAALEHRRQSAAVEGAPRGRASTESAPDAAPDEATALGDHLFGSTPAEAQETVDVFLYHEAAQIMDDYYETTNHSPDHQASFFSRRSSTNEPYTEMIRTEGKIGHLAAAEINERAYVLEAHLTGVQLHLQQVETSMSLADSVAFASARDMTQTSATDQENLRREFTGAVALDGLIERFLDAVPANFETVLSHFVE